MAKQSTEEIVRQLAQPIADGLGLTLWDVRFQKEGADMYLRITIDKEGGVLIDDCENMSRAIDPVLDEHDPISVGYYLEVSSPGLGRPLPRPQHFEAMMGKEVRVHLIRPNDGPRDFVGALTAYSGDVTLNIDGTERTFAKGEIASVKLNDDADLF